MHPKGTTLALKMDARESPGQRTIELLAKHVTPEAIAQAVASALQAETVTREGTVPDFRTRLEASKIYLNYLVGLPVQRQEIVHQAVRNDQESMDRLLASPAAVAALEKMVVEAKAKFASRGIALPFSQRPG